ncbi:MAG: hypothetical protein NZV14_03450 [Bryobacteraceae bacterium]|nr:hypothetical protein [Bryobacteraceae bacterium]MDW8377192.1 hypothetical protein [Bryobacterales bacterium]
MSPEPPHSPEAVSLRRALAELAGSPGELLIRRWNWKSALLSSLFRGGLFFGVNLSAGSSAALAAMIAEFLYRSATAGFYGALTQSLRKVTPAWHGALAALILLPTAGHTVELLIHWLRGTPKLFESIAASVGFTLISTLFHLHAMRRGVFVTGAEGRSLLWDFRALPQVLLSFLGWLPRQLGRAIRRRYLLV